MFEMPLGRLRMRIRAVNTKRELRSRAAAILAHRNLREISEVMEQLYSAADAGSDLRSGDKPKREVMN